MHPISKIEHKIWLLITAVTPVQFWGSDTLCWLPGALRVHVVHIMHPGKHTHFFFFFKFLVPAGQGHSREVSVANKKGLSRRGQGPLASRSSKNTTFLLKVVGDLNRSTVCEKERFCQDKQESPLAKHTAWGGLS